MSELATDEGSESVRGVVRQSRTPRDGAEEKRLRDRLRRIERDLLLVRRELDGDAEPLPPAAFAVLEVQVGGGRYALPISSIREVIQLVWTEPLPGAPEWVIGSFCYGEHVVPLVDLGRRLLGRPTRPDASTAIVVTDAQPPAGLAVAQVCDVVEVEPARVVPPPAGMAQAPYLIGSVIDASGGATHILSARRLSREFVLDGG